ncbi:hypothetical protein [Cronobacter malonaticus]|uniref:hypothetical protein n=2 Tax=Cronobacter malonaticus TaxID=413503 RepID=UPI000CFAEF07|nr:hypothetical protein [Cronobacter malonaticus]
MYYRVTETYDDDLYTDATVINMEDVMSFRVTIPQKLGNSFPLLHLKLDSDLRPNDYFKSGPFVIVSSKMKAILESFNAEYEFFDVVITSEKNTYPRVITFLLTYYAPQILSIKSNQFISLTILTIHSSKKLKS